MVFLDLSNKDSNSESIAVILSDNRKGREFKTERLRIYYLKAEI